MAKEGAKTTYQGYLQGVDIGHGHWGVWERFKKYLLKKRVRMQAQVRPGGLVMPSSDTGERVRQEEREKEALLEKYKRQKEENRQKELQQQEAHRKQLEEEKIQRIARQEEIREQEQNKLRRREELRLAEQKRLKRGRR